MNRRIAGALGSIALAALLAQPLVAAADPPPHARNDKSRGHHSGWSAHGDGRGYDERHWDDWESRDHDRWHRDHDGDYRRDADRYRAYHPRAGYVVQRLPRHHRVVHYHGHRYYYAGGAWYRPRGDRFVVVTPPIGLVVSFLPDFHTAVYFGGVPYYHAGPVYYVWKPKARGYVVTERPYGPY